MVNAGKSINPMGTFHSKCSIRLSHKLDSAWWPSQVVSRIMEPNNTIVDGWILHQLRLVVYPTIYKVLYIPGGAGFLPSTVVGHMHYNPTTVDSKALWMMQETARRIEQRSLADKIYTNLGWLQSIKSWWSVDSLVREF